MPERTVKNSQTEQEKETIEQLVTQVQKGDMQSFSKLYDHYVDRVYKYFYFKTTQGEAFDLTENLFIKVWDNIRIYKRKSGASFSSWLYRIAHNLLIDHYRYDRGTSELDPDQADLRHDNSPIFLAEQSLSRRSLKKAMQQLKESYREVITLAYINGLDNPELSHVLKKSEGTLRVLKFRALQELKRILQEMGIKS